MNDNITNNKQSANPASPYRKEDVTFQEENMNVTIAHPALTDEYPSAVDEGNRKIIASVSPEGIETIAYECEYCKKHFMSPAKLTSHRWQHTKPFMCGVCLLRFPAKGNLVVHRRKHTGEKPYSCSIEG